MIFLIVLQRRLNIAVQLIMELTARTNIEGTYLLVFSKYLFALWNIAIMLFQLELDWLDRLKIGCGLLLETNDRRWIF